MSNCEHKFVLYSPHTIFSIQCVCIILVNKTLGMLFVVTSSYAVRQRAVARVQGSEACPGIPAGSRQRAAAPGFSGDPSAAPGHSPRGVCPCPTDDRGQERVAHTPLLAPVLGRSCAQHCAWWRTHKSSLLASN